MHDRALGVSVYPREIFSSNVSGAQTAQDETVKEKPEEKALPAIIPAEGLPVQPDEKPEVLWYQNNVYEAAFSTRGGTLTRLVYKGDEANGDLTRTVLFDAKEEEPGIFGLRLLHEPVDLSRAIFRVNRAAKDSNVFEFVYEKPGEYRLTKEFILSRSEPIISLDVRLENLAFQERHFAMEILTGLQDEFDDARHAHEFQAVAWSDKVLSADRNKVAKKGFMATADIHWAGHVKKYFALLLKPQQTAIAYEARATAGILLGRLRMPPLEIAGQGAGRQTFFIYAGPQRYETLKSFDAGFENLLSRGFFGAFKIWLLRALKFSHQFTRNFGWDIILLTLLIKLLFAPLTHMSYKSMEKMKAVQPKLKAIQQRHKNDPAKMNKEMMELYKKHRVNPMGGCLPMLLQIPIFIAFYQVLNETIELRGAPFIGWIQDLSEPDRLIHFTFNIPLLGDGFNLLPILMLVSMYFQQKLTPQAGISPEQQKIFSFMPLIFGFIFYAMPSGLVLYWLVNNLLSIVQQVFVKRLVGVVIHHDEHEEEKK